MKKNTTIHLNSLSQASFVGLAQYTDLYCISIYLPHSFKSKISFHELVESLSNELELNRQLHKNQGLTLNSLKQHLNQIEPLIEEWAKSSETENISFFISQEQILAFSLPQAIPFKVYINDHFYIKPISQLPNSADGIKLLYLDRNRAWLFKMNHLAINRIGTFLNKSKKNRSSKVKLDFYEELKLFIETLSNTDETKIILAGRKNILKEFSSPRESKFFQELIFNPKKFHKDQLKIAAEPFLKSIEKAKEKKQLALANAQNSELKNISAATEIIKYSALGKIKALFLCKNKDVYGDFDMENDFVIIQPDPQGSTSLSNVAAINTIINNGQVFILDYHRMPSPQNKMHALINQ